MPPRHRHIPKRNQPASERPQGVAGCDSSVVQQAHPTSSVHCLLCVFPLEDITSVPCAHDGLICATCTVKITRHLAAPRCCPFCKTEWPDVIFDSANSIKPYVEYRNMNGLSCIESLAARSPAKELADKYNKLMTCHCVKCDEIGVSIDFLTLEKLQAHLRRKHQLQFCMPCAQHRKAFVGDLQLFTEAELQKHMKEGVPKSESQPGLEPHPTCQFCRVAYFGKDELYTHMEREHYHCHICFRQLNENKRYERSYKDLEIHFRKHHYLCDDPTCLTARFVVFENEIGLRGHRLQVHGGNLTQKERRAMGSVQVELMYRTPGLPPSDSHIARPLPANLPLNDPEEFPSASTSSSAMTGMGWVGPRSSSHVPLSSDNFPSLQHSVSNGLQNNRLPLHPAKPVIERCTDSNLMQERNSLLVASMKSLAVEPGAYKRFKIVSQEYLNGQGTKASDFLACFVQVFGGLDGTTQDIIESLISLLPDEQKRQALHLVYRHEVDRLRVNPASSVPQPPVRASQPSRAPSPPQWVRSGSRPSPARSIQPHVVIASANRPVPSSNSNPPRPASATAIRPQQSYSRPASAAAIRPQQANSVPPQSVSLSAPVYPTNPIVFGSRPPPVSSEELFPSLDSLASAFPATPISSDFCWKSLDDAITPMDPREIQLPVIVSRRLDLCLAFGRHCLSILKRKFEYEQGIPVSSQSIRRVQNQARRVTISDLDVGFPLNNLGVHVGSATRLQTLFRNVPDLDYSSIQDRVDSILNEMAPNDQFVLVEYVISLYKSVQSQRPISQPKPELQRQEQDACSNGNVSKRNRQRSKKRTLIQFG